MKTVKKVLKTAVPTNSAGLMMALITSMFFVSFLFLNSCADDAKDLIEAAGKGDTAGVKALLDKGAEVNARNNLGETALMVASEKGYTKIVQLLKKAGQRSNGKRGMWFSMKAALA